MSLTWTLDNTGQDSLNDGFYVLTLDGSKVHDAGGRLLDGGGTGVAGSAYIDELHRAVRRRQRRHGREQADLSIVNAAMGSDRRPAGLPTWNPNADLDRDGAVTPIDRSDVLAALGDIIIPPSASFASSPSCPWPRRPSAVPPPSSPATPRPRPL